MKSSRLSAVMAGACLALLLTACGGPSVPEDGGSYESVTDLKDALVKAGGTCDDWEEHSLSALAETAGNCGGKLALSVYSDPEALALWVETAKLMPNKSLVGKNWAVSGLKAEENRKFLGGELYGK